MLEVRDLTCGYNATPVLKNINLDIKKGDFLGIIGPNGSGKTTLLRAISRILKPQTGKIFLREKDIYQMAYRELAQNIAVVSQNTELSTLNLSVMEFVMLGRIPYLDRFQLRGKKKDLDVVQQVMALTDISDLKERALGHLSGGERQRATIAKALAQQPDLLLLDEPTAHLDINHQIEIFELIRKLNEEKSLTVITILHDLNLAGEYCRNLILLEDGRIAAQGEPIQVITEENIESVYEARVNIQLDSLTGKPQVRIPSKLPGSLKNKKIRVHLICGGGSGVDLMRRLIIEGYQVSAGVLNMGDTDQIMGESLGVTVVKEKPFSPISREAMEENEKAMQSSQLIIMERTMIGWGNVKNLESIKKALNQGKEVIILENKGEFDFTEGEGKKLYQEIITQGAKVLRDRGELLEYLLEIFH